MDTWPVSLQQKLNVDSFQYALGKTSVRTDMDVGPAKVRARFTDGVDVYNCTVLLTFAEVEIFKAFYKTTINNGVTPFTFVDPFTEDVTIFRFAEAPSISPLGGLTYQLQMTWERLPVNE